MQLSFRKWLPPRATLVKDMLAGLPGAIGSVPDGMASGLLAGASPVNGLYASAVGPVAGGATSSTALMVVTTTMAAALATSSALSGVAPESRAGALTLITVLAGAAMLGASALRLGRYTRFVSHSVMTGFLTGVSVNIVLGQLADLTGTHPDGSFALAKAVSVIIHPSRIGLAALLTGLAAMVIQVGLRRTPLASYSALLAVVIPTVGALLLHASSVATVKDSGAIPPGFPLPSLPDFRQISFPLVFGALAIAAIVLVQGAGVAESAPNPDGARSSVNRDFFAQGMANVVTSLFRGQPVGGSIGQTALNQTSGARTRWGAIFSGLWMVIILLVFSGLTGYVAQPTLAALLILAGVASIQPARIITIVRTGASSAVANVATFVATLLLPVAVAVGFGVVISLLLQLNQEAMDLRVVRLVREGPDWREGKPPNELHPHEVVVLDVYGSLLYAGSRTLQIHLPDPTAGQRAAVVLRLRGRTQLGATFFLVVEDYAIALAAAGGRLFLSGVDPALRRQHRRNAGSADRDQAELIEVVEATPILGESTALAFARAQQWVDAGPTSEQA